MEVTKSKESTQGAKDEQKPEIDPAIIDELMKGYERPEDMTGPGGILEQLTKRVYERILGAEMTHYLGYSERPGIATAGGGQEARQSSKRHEQKDPLPAKTASWRSRSRGTELAGLSRSLSAKDSDALGASIRKLSPCTPKA